jgi:hypothetical protein
MKKLSLLFLLGVLSLTPVSFISAQAQPVEYKATPALEQVNIQRKGFFKPKFILGQFYTTKIGFIRRNTVNNWGIFTKFQSSIKTRFKFDMTNNQNLVSQARCIVTSRIQHVPFKPEIALGVAEDAFGGEITIQNKEKWTFEIFNLQSMGRNPMAGYAYLESNKEEKITIEPLVTSLPILKRLVKIPSGLLFYYKGELIGQVDTYFNQRTMYYSKNVPENVQMLIANLSVAYLQFQNIVDRTPVDR